MKLQNLVLNAVYKKNKNLHSKFCRVRDLQANNKTRTFPPNILVCFYYLYFDESAKNVDGQTRYVMLY